MSYYLRGNIVDAFFMVGTDLENTSYIFSDTGNTNSMGFYHTSNFSALNSMMIPSQFTFAGGLLKTGSVYIFQNESGITSSLTVPEQKLTLKPVDHNTVGIQTGIFYRFVGSGELTFPVVIGNQKNYLIKNVRFVPIKYYGTDTCQLVDSLGSELDWINNPFTYKQRGFTTKSECDNKIFYSYCLLNEYCGDNNCYGVCKNGGSCSMNGGNYSCGTSSTGYTLYIILGIFIALVVIAILIFIFTRTETVYTFSDY